jgi:iron complex outermembrane receptor protein
VAVYVRGLQRHWIATAFACGALVSSGAGAEPQDVDLLNLSIEDLMKVEVTTVSKRAQPISQAPAAVTVITSEDIRRSGMTNVPDLLRMVPGLHVANIDASTWAITARGFNSQFANKLLVMIDGRSVYTPLFSGVYWDVQDLLLEDIERIEVVRGPGGTLWGANAVNGVINIITKDAAQTQGLLATGLGGNVDRAQAGVRYGGAISDSAHYRAYVKYWNRDDFDDRGVHAHDHWDAARGGFRADWQPTDADRVTLQGDYYGGETRETSLLLSQSDTDINGGNAIGRWTHTLSEDSDVQLRLWYDRTERDGDLLAEDRDTFDAELQHHFRPFERHDVVWGAGYRLTADRIDNSGAIVFQPRKRTVELGSGFVQDEISVIENLLSLTIGTKLEYNDYTHLEFLPNARALFTPWERHSFWLAVSRAVRAPSRAENDVSLLVPSSTPPPPNFQQLRGDSGFDSEKVLAFELGYRAQPFTRVSFDVAGYYNIFNDLRSLELRAPLFNFPAPGQITVPLVAENKLDARGYGVEVSGAWNVVDFWRLDAGYTLMLLDIEQQDSVDPTAKGQEEDTPSHQFFVRSRVDLPWHFEFDTAVYWVDEVANQGVNDYARLDARLGWHPLPSLELSLAGQNLAQHDHDEFGPSFTALPTSVPRGFYGKVTWHY